VHHHGVAILTQLREAALGKEDHWYAARLQFHFEIGGRIVGFVGIVVVEDDGVCTELDGIVDARTQVVVREPCRMRMDAVRRADAYAAA
jgi:hypothetical protein